MKNSNLLSLVVLFFVSFSLQAQFDDLYYSPSDESYAYVNTNDEVTTESTDNLAYDDAEFDYDEYEFISDYDQYYSSRIRRFRSTSPARFGYYSGYANNSFVYDPFDTYYNPSFYYNPYRRRNNTVSVIFGNPGNVYRGFYNPARRWGYYNPYNSGGVFAGNRYNTGGFGGGGFGGGANNGCPIGISSRGIGNTRSTASNRPVNPKGTYTGSRRNGSTSSSVGSSPRRSATKSTNTRSTQPTSQPRATRSTARSSSTRPSRPATKTATRPARSTRTYSKPKTTRSSSNRSSIFNSGRSTSRSSSTRSSSRSGSRSSGSSRSSGARRGN